MSPETRAFEYALGLFAVLIGLAVADIATSFHRLVRSRSPVVWDPLALLAALYALCTAVGMWFDIWGVRNFAATRHFFFYLLPGGESLRAVWYIRGLIAAASLPDEAGEANDLREYYARNRRYFWTLVALFQFGYLAHGLYFVGLPLPHEHIARPLIQMAAPLVVSLALVGVKMRAAHYAGVALLFAILTYHYASYSIN